MNPGDIVAGKYRLNQPLGSGGMAEVWSATNTFTERQVAIKFMNTEIAKTPEAAARFLNEAKVSARVNHPNIIDILDVGQTEQKQLFLVMELLTGLPLDAALGRHTPSMTLLELALIMIEVGEALAAAHKAGIVHRDLKPTNIFLHTAKGSLAPKLLDFGVSKFLEDDTNHALTVAGTVLGSPLYMSPEQARGETNLDGRTDVFAFGAILFEALCGYRPYEAKNFNALIVKIATTKPKSVDACAPHVPESLRRVVRACMETDLKLRVQTFDQVLAMMREALPELEASPLRIAAPPFDGATSLAPVVSSPSETPSGPSWQQQTPNTSYASVLSTTAPRRARSHGWLVAASAALVLGGTGVGAAFAARARSATPSLAAAPAEATPPPATTNIAAEPPRPAEPPTVAVDSLPGAKPSGALTGPVPQGSGRLSIAASPGSCAVVIDGKEHGATPVIADLTGGQHQVQCRPPTGKLRSASVAVQDGTTSKYRFALDD